MTRHEYAELAAEANRTGQIVTRDESGAAAIAAAPLPDRATLLERCRAKIDAGTDAEILAGFEFGELRFKLSLENQFNYKAEVELADSLTYPHRIKTIDGYYDVPDAATYRQFYLAAVGFIRATVETGWAAKDELEDLTAAELAAELEAE